MEQSSAGVEGEVQESTRLPVSELRWEAHGEEGSGNEAKELGSRQGKHPQVWLWSNRSMASSWHWNQASVAELQAEGNAL